MRTVRIARPGGLERLEVVERPLVEPAPGEVVVETSAIGVNYADCIVRMGLYKSAKKYVGWPITPGFEFCGKVIRVGEGVSSLQVGKRVLGITRFGAYSTHVTVKPNQLFDAPNEWSDVEVGGLAVPFLTAWYALIELCRLRPGLRVLIHSAAGGVGSAATQIAVLSGAEVTGVVGAAHKRGAALQAGARHVLERKGEGWSALARELSPEGYDVILDPNGGRTLANSYSLLRSTGRLIVYGAQGLMSRGKERPNYLHLAAGYFRTPRFHPLDMIDRNVGVSAFNLSYLFERIDLLKEAMEDVLAWVQEEKLRPLPVQTFALAEVAQAHAALESGETVGKLVLIP